MASKSLCQAKFAHEKKYFIDVFDADSGLSARGLYG